MAERQRLTVRREGSALVRAREKQVSAGRTGRADAGLLQQMSTARALQTQLVVGAPDDPYEREAEHTASAITAVGPHASSLGQRSLAASLTPVVQRAVEKAEPPKRKEKDDDDKKPKKLQKASAAIQGAEVVPTGIEADIQRLSRGGDPLPGAVRASFEPRFGYDFGGVRVHAGGEAAGAAVALGARAFTVGDHIFFGGGEYQPGTASGQKLIAHELTHTIQQQPAAGRAARTRSGPPRVQRVFEDTKASILAKVKEFAERDFQPWELLTVLLGRDPITDKLVERSARNWIHAALKLVPDGMAIFDDLEKNKSIEKTAAWFDAEVAKLDLTWDKIKALFTQAWDAIDAIDLLSPTKAWAKVKAIFGPTVKRIWDFIGAVSAKIIEFIKKTVLDKIAAWARDKPGYTLLTFILGKDPVTGEQVKRTPKGFAFAVLDLVPGGDKIKENLEKSKAIEKTVAWLDAEITKLDLTWDKIKELFTKAWNAFKVVDLLTPKVFLEKMGEIFGPPLGRLLAFVVAVGKKILEFIFEGAMLIAGPIGEQIVRIFHKIGDTFNKIVDDPVGFVHNLVQAVKLGFQQFAKNIWEHLKTGLIEWLVGTLEGAGLVLPKVWDLKGILDLALQVLGITYAKMRAKLVKVIGEDRVAMLERVFGFIKTLVTEGPAAAWQQIVAAIGSLWDLVIGGIKDWAITKIVTAAITKLVTMFNPAGAIIQSIIAIYNTVAFFVERIKQILALVEAIVDSIANIAAGKLTQAANFVERAMARTIPVILGFLARLIGLGNVSDAVKKVITALQEKVDKGIDAVIAWVVEKAKSLFGGKEADKPKPAETEADAKWNAGVAGVEGELTTMSEGGLEEEAIEKAIPTWKVKYGFKSLAVEDTAEGWAITGEMSPKKTVRTIPFPKITFVSTTSGGKATKVHAVPLGRTPYAAPAAEPVGWDRLNHNYWVRGHLVHGRSGGPGEVWNLVPIPKSTNARMYSGHEEAIYTSLGKRPKPLVWYVCEVSYWDTGGPEKITQPSQFPKRLTVRYGEAKLKKDQSFTDLTKGEKKETYDVALPTKASGTDFKP